MPRILRWYDDLESISAGRMNVVFDMIWCRGCLDLAIQLRGYDNLIIDTFERPQFVHDLLKWLVEQRCRWWEGYHKHFRQKAGPVGIADDWINVPYITPEFFADFVLPCYLEIEAFHGGLKRVHSCGNQVPIQKYLLELKSLDFFEVSPWSDLNDSLENIPPNNFIHVALHPNDVLLATQRQMREKLEFIARACRGRDYDIGTSGLSPVSDDIGRFIDQISMWLSVAQD